MSAGSATRAADRAARAGDGAALALLLGIAGVLTAALVLQIAFGEIPCPLCLLERVAMFGIAFGPVARFRGLDRGRAAGASLLSATVLLVVSVRQVLNDIVPRPGHGYVGSAVLGLHMPVWAVLVAVAALFGIAFDLLVAGGRPREDAPSPALARVATPASLFVVLLCLANLAAVVLQCGLGACHTDGYALLR